MSFTVPYIINAICTPLEADESLHRKGLEAHLEAQWSHGASGILVGGTMGLMQLLRDDTYRTLVRESAVLSQGRGEVLVGIGDTSYVRTRARLDVVVEETRDAKVDGVVVVTPYFLKYPKADLIRYYHRLADESPIPLFVYYLPGTTGVTLDFDTVVQIAAHPNVHGIKCSCDIAWTQQLKEQVPDSFRVIAAQPYIAAFLSRMGFRENLDGIYAVLPKLTQRMATACATGDWAQAEAAQALFTRLLHLLRSNYGVFQASEALLNLQGVEGKLCIEPTRSLSDAQRESLFAEPVVCEILNFTR